MKKEGLDASASSTRSSGSVISGSAFTSFQNWSICCDFWDCCAMLIFDGEKLYSERTRPCMEACVVSVWACAMQETARTTNKVRRLRNPMRFSLSFGSGEILRPREFAVCDLHLSSRSEAKGSAFSSL